MARDDTGMAAGATSSQVGGVLRRLDLVGASFRLAGGDLDRAVRLLHGDALYRGSSSQPL